MEENKELEKPHKRRVRYKGTHPRKFEEKYKELQTQKNTEIRFKKLLVKEVHRQECTFPSV